MIKPKRVWDNKKRTVRQWKKQVRDLDWNLKVNNGNRREDADSSQFQVYDNTWETPETPYQVYDKSWEEIWWGWGGTTLWTSFTLFWLNSESKRVLQFTDSNGIICMDWTFTTADWVTVSDFSISAWTWEIGEKVLNLNWDPLQSNADQVLFNLGLSWNLISTDTMINGYLTWTMFDALSNFIDTSDTNYLSGIYATLSIWNTLINWSSWIQEYDSITDEWIDISWSTPQVYWYPQKNSWYWTIYNSQSWVSYVAYDSDNEKFELKGIFALSYFIIDTDGNQNYWNIFDSLLNRYSDSIIWIFGMYSSTVNTVGGDVWGLLNNLIDYPSADSVSWIGNWLSSNQYNLNLVVWTPQFSSNGVYEYDSDNNTDMFEFQIEDENKNADILWGIYLDKTLEVASFNFSGTVAWAYQLNNVVVATTLSIDQWKAILDYDNKTNVWIWDETFLNYINGAMFEANPTSYPANIESYIQEKYNWWWKIITWTPIS